MESSTARRDYMESQLSKFNIPFERFNAVCPTSNDLKHPTGKYREFFERRHWPGRNDGDSEPTEKKYTKSIFGAYLSQYYIHKKALSSNWGNYVILEDDCKLFDDWYELLQRLFDKKLIPNDWDMIRSCWHENHTSECSVVEKFCNSHKQSKFYDKHLSENRIHNGGGAHFTLFNKNSVKKILNFMDEDWVCTPDYVYSSHILNVYHTLVCQVDPTLEDQERRNLNGDL